MKNFRVLLACCLALVATVTVAAAQSSSPPTSPWSFSGAWDSRLNKPVALVIHSPLTLPMRPNLTLSYDLFAGAVLQSNQGGGSVTGGTGFSLHWAIPKGPTFVLGAGEAIYAGAAPHQALYGGASFKF